MPILYLLFVKLTGYLLPLIAFFSKNRKIKQFAEGQKNLFGNLKLPHHPNRYWFHCASLGEFEQARPVIEKLKKTDPSIGIVISFFSPSGYEQRKNYNLAEAVIYLPLDTPANADRLLDIIQPKAAIFVKYEIWYFHLTALFKHKIPVYLISANFRKNQAIFSVFGQWLFKLLPRYTYIFLQDNTAFELLKNKGLTNISISGDTRFDRVAQNAGHMEKNRKLESFVNGNSLIILGSSWPAEETFFRQFLESEAPEKEKPGEEKDKKFRYIIAPHDISPDHIAEIQEKFNKWQPVLYTGYDEISESGLMVLDTIGNLASAYQYADMAIIGGGFTGQLHNILEPLAFGVPVITGPVHHKFPEAASARAEGVLLEFTNATELLDAVNRFKKNDLSNIASGFVSARTGASETVVKMILDKSIENQVS